MKSKSTTKSKSLAETKLLSSGLTVEDAKILGIEFLSQQETAKLCFSYKPLASLKINYYDPSGKPLSDVPKGKPFYRIRYLEQGTDFGSLAEKKPARYVQEPNTIPVAYYPKNQEDWVGICKNPNNPLIITEGELKANKACKEGFPTIGLGGVYNFRSNKMGVPWLPSLDFVNWLRRNVYIVFDSDYRTNPLVCNALKALADELHDRGAFCFIVSLPQLTQEDKVGLDDFLVQSGPSANDQFRKLLADAEPLGLTKPLFGFNERFVYVQNPGLIIDQKTRFKISPSAFKEHSQSAVSYQERKLNLDGTISYKATSAAASWLKWPIRSEVSKMSYLPGKDKFVEQKGNLVFNTWPGWGVEPRKGDVSPFLDLVDHLFTGSEKEARTWFLRWCAFPLQNPGVKMFTSVVIHGIRHGTGKSLIGYTLGRIYGENFTEIDQGDLHANFNEWAECKQLVLGDDVTGTNKRADADFLKKMITQRELRVNTKFIPSYTVPDCINYYFTANGPDSFFLEDDDRRSFIHEVIVGPLSEEFYFEYDMWLDTGGSAAVFDYLLKLDLGDFNPAAPAFRTEAKNRMIATVQSDLASWCRSLLQTPNHILKVGEITINKDLFTSKELLQFYDPHGKTGTTANGLGRELARAGIRQVANGRPVKLADGSQGRYYAVRNSDSWLSKPQTAVSKYLDQWNNKQNYK